jgi:hypothetical protein
MDNRFVRIVAAALWAALGLVMAILVPGWPLFFSLVMVVEAHLIFIGGKVGLGAAALGAAAFGVWVGFVVVVTLFIWPDWQRNWYTAYVALIPAGIVVVTTVAAREIRLTSRGPQKDVPALRSPA